jgi:hypothetical protein
MRSLLTWLAQLYRPVPEDISGAEASYRTFPWCVPFVIGPVVVALIFPNSLLGEVLIVAVSVLVGAGWWRQVGRHWHPIDRIRH